MAKAPFQCASGLFSIMLLAARPAEAAPPETPAPIPTTLDFDTQILDPELGQRIRARLTEQLGPTLAARGYLIMPDSTAVTSLRIEVTAFDTDQRNYEVEVQLRTPDAEPIRRTVVCKACNESRLVDRIVEQAPELLAAKVEAPAPVEPEPGPELTPPTSTPLGLLGLTGAAMGTVGTLVAGIGILRLDNGVTRETSRLHAEVVTRDDRPAGATVTVLGVATMIAGVTLVVLDVTRRRSAYRSHAIHVSPTYVGFQIAHRF